MNADSTNYAFEQILEICHPKVNFFQKHFPFMSGYRCKVAVQMNFGKAIAAVLNYQICTTESTQREPKEWIPVSEKHLQAIRLTPKRPYLIKFAVELNNSSFDTLFEIKKILIGLSSEQVLLQLMVTGKYGESVELFNFNASHLMDLIKGAYPEVMAEPELLLLEASYDGKKIVLQQDTTQLLSIITMPYTTIELDFRYAIENRKCGDEIKQYILDWAAVHNFKTSLETVYIQDNKVSFSAIYYIDCRVSQLPLIPGKENPAFRIDYERCYWKWKNESARWGTRGGQPFSLDDSIPVPLELQVDSCGGSDVVIKGKAVVRLSLLERGTFMQILAERSVVSTDIPHLTYRILEIEDDSGDLECFCNEIIFEYFNSINSNSTQPRRREIVTIKDEDGARQLSFQLSFKPSFRWHLAVDFGTSGISAAVYLQKSNKNPLEINRHNLDYWKDHKINANELLEQSPYISASVVEYNFVGNQVQYTPAVRKADKIRAKWMIIENFKMLTLLKLYPLRQKRDDDSFSLRYYKTHEILQQIFEIFLSDYEMLGDDGQNVTRKHLELNQIVQYGPWINEIILTIPNSFSFDIIKPVYDEIKKTIWRKIRGRDLLPNKTDQIELPCVFSYLSESDAILSYYLKSGAIEHILEKRFHAIVLDIGAGTTDLSLAHVNLGGVSEDVKFLGHIGFPAGGNFFDFIIAEAFVKYCEKKGIILKVGLPSLYVNGASGDGFKIGDHHTLRNFIRDEIKPNWGAEKIPIEPYAVIKKGTLTFDESFYNDLLNIEVDTACGSALTLNKIIKLVTTDLIKYLIRASASSEVSTGSVDKFKIFLSGRGGRWQPVRTMLKNYSHKNGSGENIIEVIEPFDEKEQDLNAKTMVAKGATWFSRDFGSDDSGSFGSQTMLSYFAVLIGSNNKVNLCVPLYEYWRKSQTTLAKVCFTAEKHNTQGAEELKIFSVYLDNEYDSSSEYPLIKNVPIMCASKTLKNVRAIDIIPKNEKDLINPVWECILHYNNQSDYFGPHTLYPPDLTGANLDRSEIFDQAMWPFQFPKVKNGLTV
jgi:hypothetical protein